MNHFFELIKTELQRSPEDYTTLLHFKSVKKSKRIHMDVQKNIDITEIESTH